ncbi:MAG: hypothetical protein COV76_08680 [Candidatus Omnitrophica bacterium CG11_big_fil_rev_8_21_14_0_20_64_10]|nr:MAG: hypothetical protein COV76_08680 [Candidatus Omnitrophica bacterium CG11_big_fil_rev_8_21_14_0_20_64_10]
MTPKKLLKKTLLKALLCFNAAPLCARLSRTGMFPKRFWRRLAGLASEIDLSDQPREILLPLPGRRTMRLQLDLHEEMEWEIYFFGTHEPGTTAFLKRRFSDPRLRVVYDIGSNIGYYAILAAALMPEGRQVEAFEPVPWMFEMLEKNARLNGLKNLRAHEAAVGRETGVAPLFLPRGRQIPSTNGTLQKAWAAGFLREPGSPLDQIQVRVEQLDRLIEQKVLPVPEMIRMDIEGSEADALAGMGRTLERHGPELVLEVLEPAFGPIGELLRKANYVTYRIEPNGAIQESSLEPHPKATRDWYAARRI